jgi:hypothetical protein
MPTSHPFQLNELTNLILLINPKTVLDIGVGFGKYGFLTREYLELWTQTSNYHNWTRQIDGVEAYQNYLTPIHAYIYNHVYIGDALKVLPNLKTTYDLILLIDVLEHFSYEDGVKLLEACQDHAKNILISTPFDIGNQTTSFGNELETHRFQWQKKHFADYPNRLFIPNPQSLIIYIGTDEETKTKIKAYYHTMFTTQISVALRSLLLR